MIRRTIYFLLVTIVFGVIGGGVAMWSFNIKPKFLEEVILKAPRPAETVSAEPAKEEAWEPEIAAIGTITEKNGINITPQVGGVVREVFFESGQSVKKGDKIITFDIDTEEAQLKSAEAQLANAEMELARRQKVFKKGFAAKADIDTLRTARDTAAAEVERLKAVIAQKSIYAPWSGRLGFKDVAPGKYVAPGQTVVWLQSVDPVFVDFPVTEAEFATIKTGQPIEAMVNAYEDRTFTGKIVMTDAKMAQESRSIMIRAELANGDGALVPGMYANVKVTVGTPEKVVTVPQTAVTFSLYGDSVFVVVPAKKPDPNAKEKELEVERRFVKTGRVRDSRIAIVSGLASGDQVVTAGQNKIDQGSKVKIDNSIALNPVKGPVIQ
jgi:membrane fusion protein (multidrug efflux system)